MATLDEHKVALVSVTQHFNTASSMGRLILNILLSFAQFERETIAERVSDKMCAARRKGKYVGGIPPLGYDVVNKQLVINEEEATQVRTLFASYLKHGAMLTVVQEAKQKGWTAKSWTTKKGNHRKGKAFNRNSMHKLLTNPVYMGKISHQDKLYPGEHEPIVDEDTWKRTQSLLKANFHGDKQRISSEALLLGLLHCDACGCPMTHTYTARKNKRYRYYVCTRARREGYAACPNKPIPAMELETFAVNQIKCVARDEAMVEQVVKDCQGEHQEARKRIEQELQTIQQTKSRLQAEMGTLLNATTTTTEECTDNTRNLARIGEEIHLAELQASASREALQQLEDTRLNEASIKEALHAFDPIWKQIPPAERQELMGLLIERIDFKGDALTIDFKSTGIQSLVKQIQEGAAA